MIKNLLKGIVVGVANILPGVSGGMLLISMGIYDKLIYCVNHLFTEFKNNVKFLFPIALGVIIALIAVPLALEPAFKMFPLQANCLFIGLILGGVPTLAGKLRDKGGKVHVKPGYIISFIVFFAVILGTAIVGDTKEVSVAFSFDFWSIVKLFLIGVLIASTIIIPGLSGSMLLLVLGYYTPMLETINLFVKSCVALDFAGALLAAGFLIPIGLGIVAGVFGLAKLIEIMLKRYPFHSYWAILGLIVASPVAILLVADISSISILGAVTSVAALAAGIFTAIKLGD